MMNKALSIYRTINTLSIDVAVGAMCSALFLGGVLQANISYVAVAVLGLVVWTIYTADHLLDVTRLAKTGLPCRTPRHQFHQRYFKKLSVVLIIVCLLILVLLLFIPQQIVIAGIGLTTIVALYLLLNSFLSFGKEFIITIGYVGGVLVPAQISVEQLLFSSTILLCFFITVLFNVLVFSYFDFEIDKIENKKSFVRVIGLNQVHFLLVLLFFVQLGLSITHHAPAAILLITMTSIMAGILYFKVSIGLLMCRIIGEAIFLLPGFYWAFA